MLITLGDVSFTIYLCCGVSTPRARARARALRISRSEIAWNFFIPKSKTTAAKLSNRTGFLGADEFRSVAEGEFVGVEMVFSCLEAVSVKECCCL